MKKKTALFVLSAVLVIAMSGCGKKEESTTIAATEAIVTQATVSDASVSDATIEEPKTEEVSAHSLEDGTYVVDFETDSSMFHVNDSKNGKGLLTVEDGKMTVHIVLTSKNIVNLYYGLAEDAQKEGAKLLEPTPEEVTYADGTSEEVNSFDVPVPYLDKEFDVALIGKKGVWYDHKVSVSNPETIGATNQSMTVVACEDGEYTIEVGTSSEDIRLTASLTVTDGVTAMSPYPDGISEKMKGAARIGNTEFADLLGTPLPEEPPVLPLTMESRFCDFQKTFMGRILYNAVCGVAKRQLKKAKKMPRGTERDNRIKGAIFLQRIFDTNCVRTLSLSAGKSMPWNIAEGFVQFGNGHFFRGIAAMCKSYKIKGADNK